MSNATTIKITGEKLKALGWSHVNDHMVLDLNRTIEKYSINTPPRIRHFLSQTAHESGLGKWTKELADGKIYEHRKDLGNIHPGDGPKFKGAGYIQLTGRKNYQQFANDMGDPRIMEGADYVSKTYPWASAGFWWKLNGMNKACDNGESVEQITIRVNGGKNGLQDRWEQYGMVTKVLV
ncbi:endopeptidase [Bacillus wiedmannii]|uniref:glycoside hydrolase family 19 protein n=1 Tax=Bacillus TaxID=1386 RepID=UPI000BF69383|nr:MULTISPECIES: endopeptidase [Bacillus]PEP31666.1 endopeptidase [Bacillus wiedmannii]PHF26645.1 endopeptidase [Bacillus wiedmannii]